MKFMKFFSIFLLLFELYSSTSVVKRKASSLEDVLQPLVATDNRQTIKTIEQWDSATTDEIIKYMSPAFGEQKSGVKKCLKNLMLSINTPEEYREIKSIPHIVLARIYMVDNGKTTEYKIPQIFCSGNIRTKVVERFENACKKIVGVNLDLITPYIYTSGCKYIICDGGEQKLAHSERAVGGYLLEELDPYFKKKDIIIQIRTSLPMCAYCQSFWNGESCLKMLPKNESAKMYFGRPCFVKYNGYENYPLFKKIKDNLEYNNINAHVSRNMHKYPYNNDTGVSSSVVIFKGDANV